MPWNGKPGEFSFVATSVQLGFLVRLQFTRVHLRGLLSIDSISVGLFLLVASTTRRSARRGYFGPTWTIACRTPTMVRGFCLGSSSTTSMAPWAVLTTPKVDLRPFSCQFRVPHHMTPCDTPTSRFGRARGAFGARTSLFRAARTFLYAPTTPR